MKRFAILALVVFAGCSNTSDDQQQRLQETIAAEGVAAVGLPSIHNFFEKRQLKQIYELRDQADLTTYTYLYNEMQGKLVFLGESIGYGIPSATQYTNPQKSVYSSLSLPQADPNGLFSPQSAEGTWILLKDPHGKGVKPVYVEPRVIVSPFRLEIQ